MPLRDCKGIGYMLQRNASFQDTTQLMNNSLIKSKLKCSVQVKVEAPLIGKCVLFYNHHLSVYDSTVTLTIEQIEKIVGYSLPASGMVGERYHAFSSEGMAACGLGSVWCILPTDNV